MNIKDMSPKEIVDAVESGKIESESFNSFAEYVRGMER